MRRIYPAFTYSDAPRRGCWWDQTVPAAPSRPRLDGDLSCDVAIIGAGYTGISAALHLAEAGISAVVLESEYVGWGASGRNGGFCCLGGGMLSNAELDATFGHRARSEWRQTEVAAIRLAEDLISRFGLEVDRHSDGETQLAHRPQDVERLRAEVDDLAECYGLEARLTEKRELETAGMNAGFHGALTVPVGFGLNPRKFISGLATAAEQAGARICEGTSVTDVARAPQGWRVQTSQGTLRAEKVIFATNGYSSEDLPSWFAGRYMPTQSSVLVTRPMTEAELGAQGWTSGQACYDTRNLLHYFRLMPDNRMLFGVRGGLLANARSEARALARARRDFDVMFPAWRAVETPHGWSGLVCIARQRMPYVGPVPDAPGLFAGLCYHGNGVAMAPYCGALLADLAMDRTPQRAYPKAVKRPLARFELGRFRRAMMPLAYAGFALADR